jgi:hypothetical protein
MPGEYEGPSKQELLKRLQAKVTGLTDDELDIENLRQRLASASAHVEKDSVPVLIDAVDPGEPLMDPDPPPVRNPVLVMDLDMTDQPNPV